MTKETRIATLCALLGNGIFGFSFMFSRVALGIASPFVMLMHRFILAFLGLAAVAAYASAKELTHTQDGSIHFLRFSLRGKNIAPLLMLGVVQPVLYFLCESYGITMTNASFSGVIIALVPIAALALGAVFLRETPSRAQVGWSVLSIAGVVLMTMMQSAEGEIRALGVLLLFGAVLSGVMFNIISRRISGAFSALERTVVMMAVAAAAFTALAVWETRGDLRALVAPLSSGAFLASLLYLSIASSIGAFMLINFASNTLPVAKTTAFCNLTTVISVFAGVVFLGEPFGAVSLLASAMIIAGIWGVQRAQMRAE